MDTATSAWTGATSVTWATATTTNWSTGVVPTASIGALFGPLFTGSNQPRISAGATAQGIHLANGATQDVTITGLSTAQVLNITGTAELGGQTNAGIMLNDVTGTNNSLTIGDLVTTTLTNNTGFYVNSAGTLTLSGTGTLNLNAKTLTLAGTGASGTTNIAQVISSATGAIIVNTAGTVTLSGTNTYGTAGTNYTTLTAGTLNLNNTQAVGNGTFTINGGKINTTNATAGLTTINNAQIWGGNFEFVGTSNFSLGTGTVNLNGGTRRVTTTANTLTVGGNISNGALTKAGSGTLQLGAVGSSWVGGLVIEAGNVIGGASTTTFGATTNAITLGHTSGSANTQLTPFNSGTYLQPITVKGGNSGVATLMLGTTTGAAIWGGTITLDTHDLTIAKQGTTGATQVTGGITGTGNLTIDNDGTSGTITLATGAINPIGSISNVGSATGTTTISAAIGSNVTNVIQNSATSGLTLSNAGNSYTGATTISAGILNAATFAPGGSNSSIGAAAVAATNLVLNGGTLQYNTAAAATTNRLFSVGTSGGTIDSSEATAANSLSFTGTGDIGLNSQLGTRTLTLTGTNTGSNTIALKIVNDASANATNLTKAGAGTWILTNANTYTGTTTIGGGVTSALQAGNASALGVGGNITFNGNGMIRYTAASAAVDYSSRFKNSTFAIGVDTNSQNVTFGTNIDSSNIGGQGLTKFGAGTLTLSVANSYTGSTQIAGGTLRLGHINALGTTAPSVTFNTASGNILQIGTDTPFVAANLPSISAGFSSSGTTNIVSDRLTTGAGLTHALGALSIGNTQMNITAGTNVTSGTAAISFTSVGMSSATTAQTTTFNPTTANMIVVGNVTGSASTGTHTLALGGTSPGNSIGGIIENGGRTTQNLTKFSTSIWTLSGTNTYNGATQIDGGILTFANKASKTVATANAAAAGSVGLGVKISDAAYYSATDVGDLFNTNTLTGFNLNAASGVAIDTSNAGADFDQTVALTAARALTKLGTGTLLLSQTNTYTGTTTINQGTLKLGVNHTLTGALNFGFSPSGVGTTTGALDLTDVNATFGGLNVRTNNSAANTITIGSGKTLTLTGSTVANVLTVGGSSRDFASTMSAKLVITGATAGVGTLTVTDATRNIVVSSLAAPASAASPSEMDLSGLGTFNATIANLYVGRPTLVGGTASNGNGKPQFDILTLAAANTINATGVISVGGSNASNGQNQATPATLLLGTNNSLTAASFVIGSSRTSGKMAFNTGLTNPTVTIRGFSGVTSDRTNIYLGDQGNLQSVSNSAGGSTSNLGTMDFTGGSVDAKIDNLFVGMGGTGFSSRTRGDGNFIMDGVTSNVDVNTLEIGRTIATETATPGGTSSIGTFTVTNGTLQVNTAMTIAKDYDTSATPSGIVNVQGTFIVAGGNATIGALATPIGITLGSHVNSGNSGLATAAVSVTGGTLNVFGNIQEGNLGAGTITSSLSVNGGILDMKGGNITSLDIITYTTGTVKNLGTVNTGMTLAGSGSRVFDQGATALLGDIQGTITGTGVGLTKQGLGNLTLSGTNSYDGPTTLTAGTLSVGLTANLGAAASNLVFDGGTLQITGTTLANVSGIGHTVLFNATKTVGLDINNSGQTFTVDQVLDQTTGGFTKLGAGTAILNQANTYTGATTVTLGKLVLNRSAADNTTILTDANTATTSDILINGGTLEIAASEQIANTGSIEMTSGAFNFGAVTGKTETIDKFTNSGGTFSTGANTLIGLGNTITWSGGTNTVNAGGNVQDQHIVISGGTNTVEGGNPVGGVLQLNNGGTGLEMSNGATLTLNSDATTGGKLLLKGNVSTSGNSTVTIASGSSGNSKGNIDLDTGTRDFTVADGTAATDFAISAVITNGGLVKKGAGTLVLSGINSYSSDTYAVGGTLAFASGGSSNSSTIRLGETSGTDAATLAITDAAGGNAVNSTLVVRAGSSGVKTIKATNTSGTSTFGGSVYLDADVTTSADTVGGTLAFTGTDFDLKGQKLTATGSGDTTISNILQNSSGSGTIVKQGTGTLVLSGANTYSGNTEIDSGTIRVDGTPGNATSNYYVGNGGTTGTAASLMLGGAGGTGGGVTLSNLIAINAGTANNRTLGGTNSTGTTNTFAGTTYSNGAGGLTVTSTNAGAILAFTNASAIDLKGTNVLFNGAGNTNVSGAVYNSTGSGSVTKEGTGTLTFSVANSYTGGTTVSAGTLAISGTGTAGTAGIAISGASAATLQIGAGITLAGNNITFSNTNALSKVVHDVAISGTYSTGTSGTLTTSFVGGQADTTAEILDGTRTLGSTLEMLFAGTSGATNDGIRRSDVFTTAGTSTDTYVIQLSTSVALAADSVLGWLNGSNEWVNAVTGNTGGAANFIAGAWNNSYTLGTYGYDSAGTGKVWAVVNHGGAFTAVPEPTSALVGLLIGAGLLRRRRSA